MTTIRTCRGRAARTRSCDSGLPSEVVRPPAAPLGTRRGEATSKPPLFQVVGRAAGRRRAARRQPRDTDMPFEIFGALRCAGLVAALRLPGPFYVFGLLWPPSRSIAVSLLPRACRLGWRAFGLYAALRVAYPTTGQGGQQMGIVPPPCCRILRLFGPFCSTPIARSEPPLRACLSLLSVFSLHSLFAHQREPRDVQKRRSLGWRPFARVGERPPVQAPRASSRPGAEACHPRG